MLPTGSPHTYTLRVYYEDTDAGGIVYHASYLRFAERARTEALRAAGAAHADLVAEHGLSFVVRRVEMRYLRPARLDDEITVITEATALGAASATLRQSFSGAGGALGVLHVELACIRNTDGKPARIPARWCAALAVAALANTGRTGAEAGGEDREQTA